MSSNTITYQGEIKSINKAGSLLEITLAWNSRSIMTYLPWEQYRTLRYTFSLRVRSVERLGDGALALFRSHDGHRAYLYPKNKPWARFITAREVVCPNGKNGKKRK